METDVMGVGTGAPSRQAGVPRCQFCGADPLPIIPAFVVVGAWQVVVFQCAGCGSTHGTQIIGAAQAPQQSNIIRP